MKNLAVALVKAQKDLSSPELRMIEASLLRDVFMDNPPIPQRNKSSALDRLMSKVMFGASDCWYYVGSTDANGYGRLPVIGESKAHRVSYKIFHGEIPNEMKVMHNCDTRCCVNPQHLSLGTQMDNVKDMMSKGRLKPPTPLSGELNPMAKLTQSKVDEIRAIYKTGKSQKSIAEKFGVSRMAISRVVRMESWK